MESDEEVARRLHLLINGSVRRNQARSEEVSRFAAPGRNGPRRGSEAADTDMIDAKESMSGTMPHRDTHFCKNSLCTYESALIITSVQVS